MKKSRSSPFRFRTPAPLPYPVTLRPLRLQFSIRTSDPVQTNNLIDGRWVRASDGAALGVTNPASDALIAEVPSVGALEVRAAIDAAARAQPEWARRSAPDRGALVAALAHLMRRDAERLALLMTLEQGKPRAEARGEIDYAASFLENAAEEGKRLAGEIIPASTSDKRLLVLRQSVGLVAIITPWNFPSAMMTRKLGPALAAGCAVVIKPAEETPLSALAIGDLALEAGFPPGLINILTGDPRTIGDALLSDPRIRALSFTGSTAVGRLLMAKASDNLLRVSLELGGHAPFLVFDDADLDLAVAAAIACKFRNAGQACISANRFFVHERLAPEFARRFRLAIESLTVGDGAREGVHIGPLINDDAIRKVETHVRDALSLGATLSTGGRRVSLPGLADRFYAPTLLERVTPDMLISREETFGPVAALSTFTDEREAIARANATPFGLAAYFFTRDASRIWRVAEALEFGIIGVNDARPSTAQAPFGGVKHSGVGREGGRYAFDEYTELKYLSWRI